MLARSIARLLQVGADDDVAVVAPGRLPLTYARLRADADRVTTTLNRLGIGRNDRVAIVLANGPEMAATFITVAAAATTAPLNPGYRGPELEFALRDLAPKALIVAAGYDGAAVEAASRLGIRRLELSVGDGAPAGHFALHEVAPMTAASGVVHGGFADADDIALVLHTSGTTSRPKLVPLSHRNVCSSACNIARTFALTPADRCLNVMPLFHIHGLIGALLSSLSAGASIACTPGFDAFQFFRWLGELRPTWYTAAPSMHEAILARGARQRAMNHRLRFIRSCSSALPPPLMAGMEAFFGVPVVESYGMTEAAHQIASNRLPPARRKPGTVGCASGAEVAIMDGDGRLLTAGEVGEVVVRGDNVTEGYERNPEANAAAFTHGWFRTGDQGRLDAEGYLTLTGRLKELINRGGEKISPREIDDVLLDHPAVAQALAFGVPHASLGEEVAAAVVLRPGHSATPGDLREFVAARLAPFKVPRKVLILDELPMGPTGKPQRTGLADRLGLSAVGGER